MSAIQKQLNSLGDDADLADAEAILHVYRALIDFPGTRDRFVNRTAREALQQVWQEPRMPRQRAGHNKPLEYPWSSNARTAYAENRWKGALVLDHAAPIGELTASLMAASGARVPSGATFLRTLREAHAELSFVVITRDENNALTALGLRSTRPSSIYGRWEGYRRIGLRQDDFRAVLD